MQVETVSTQLSTNMKIDMTVDSSLILGYSSSTSWCQNNIRAVKQVGDTWTRLSGALDCSLWPTFARISTNTPGTYGYEV
jgi:hypothetical protein